MKLSEIYETLVRRGMPEHPNLRPVAGLLMHRAFDDDDGGNGGGGPCALSDTDTRDILTMHALRWADEVVSSYEIISVHELAGGGWCLDSIVDATAHLEPDSDAP